MSPLDLQRLGEMEQPGAGPEAWIRVGMDTGGIAAGAGKTFTAIERALAGGNSGVDVLRTGSLGYSYADPLVEVCVPDMPRLLYGKATADIGEKIVGEHVLGGRLVDDHAMASRQRSASLDRPVSFILVKDTSHVDGDKTEFCQFSLQEELKRRGLDPKVQVVRAFDMGLYDEGVVVQLLPSGVTYTNVLASDIVRVVEESVGGGRVIEDLLCRTPERQLRIVLRNCGIVDPESLEDSIRHGGYRGLRRALAECSPEQVLDILKESGLRGRGGAGFPTWMKWKLTREAAGDRKFVICNGDEGDPGAFMDRSVLEGDPHAVLEGMILAAYAIGASMGYFYIRAEYPMAVARIEKAIREARAAGLLGGDILGTGFAFDAKVRLGAGAFVCGEETALIASIEGRRGSPSPRPPFPSVRGLFGKPTAINNVETLAAVGAIVANGGEWYARHGTEKSKGTKVFAVTGKVQNAQLVEVPMGTTLRQVIYEICGGVLDGAEFKAVQTGGPSGGVIPEEHLDTPISYENLLELGSIMGSGGMLVMDRGDCMVDVTKFYLKFCVDESCGKCAPCRVGGFQMLQLLDKISRGRGVPEDIPALLRICSAMQKASLCGLGQTAPNPVLSTLRFFRPEYDAYVEGGFSYAKKMARQLAGEVSTK